MRERKASWYSSRCREVQSNNSFSKNCAGPNPATLSPATVIFLIIVQTWPKHNLKLSRRLKTPLLCINTMINWDSGGLRLRLKQDFPLKSRPTSNWSKKIQKKAQNSIKNKSRFRNPSFWVRPSFPENLISLVFEKIVFWPVFEPRSEIFKSIDNHRMLKKRKFWSN